MLRISSVKVVVIMRDMNMVEVSLVVVVEVNGERDLL